jgi:hypothetical protein
MGKYLIDNFNVYRAKIAAREKKIRRKRMPIKNHEITFSGVTWRIPALLNYIAEKLRENEGWKPEPPPPEPTPPTRFSIHWQTAGNGAWHGFLVAHWEYQKEMGAIDYKHDKSHECNTTILRITVDPFTGNFRSKCILDPKRVCAVSPTFDECKKGTEDVVLSLPMLRELHILCIKEDYNKVKVNWWE